MLLPGDSVINHGADADHICHIREEGQWQDDHQIAGSSLPCPAYVQTSSQHALGLFYCVQIDSLMGQTAALG